MTDNEEGSDWGSAHIISHNCERAGSGRDYQYARYGEGRVVANKGRAGILTCTVCGKEV